MTADRPRLRCLRNLCYVVAAPIADEVERSHAIEHAENR